MRCYVFYALGNVESGGETEYLGGVNWVAMTRVCVGLGCASTIEVEWSLREKI